MPNHVVVRDGRIGGDRTVDPEGTAGPVLFRFATDRVYDLGDRLTLSDGTEVEVIRENFSLDKAHNDRDGKIVIEESTQIVHIGNVRDESQ